MTDQTKVANVFQKLDRKRQVELLASVCSNMIENQAWDDIANLLVTQLGYADTMTLMVADAKDRF